MSKTQETPARVLRRRLVGLYPSASQIQRVLVDAGIRLGNISFQGSASDMWFSALAEVDRLGRRQALLDVVADEYPGPRGSARASGALTRWREKLEHLLEAEALEDDPARQFKLEHQIQVARTKIAALADEGRTKGKVGTEGD